MVMNSTLVVTVAKVSADVCQYIACNPERLSSEQALNLIFCLPLQQLRRLALSLWNYVCFVPPDFTTSSSSSSSFSSNYDSHSDWSFISLYSTFATMSFEWVNYIQVKEKIKRNKECFLILFLIYVGYIRKKRESIGLYSPRLSWALW